MIKRDIVKIKRKKQSEQQLMALPLKQTFFQNTPTEKIFFLAKSFKQSCASINCVLSRNILQRIVLQINDLIERYQTISIIFVMNQKVNHLDLIDNGSRIIP